MSNENFVQDNKGFTLMEMLVSLAVSSMVMLGLVVFMSAASKSYKITNDETTVQTEAQNTMNYVRNMILEGCEFEYVNTTSSTYLAFKTNKEEKKLTMNYIVYDKNKLYYYTNLYEIKPGKTDFAIDPVTDVNDAVKTENLMAEYIKDDGFKVQINIKKEKDSEGKEIKKLKDIFVQLDFKKDNNSMSTKEVIKPRNNNAL